MSQPFIAEIRLFGFNFAPRGWAFCNGQTMAIAQNTALFALVGTTYGGNGTTTFGLPNLQGRTPIHQGSGPGLSTYSLGESGGVTSVTLLSSQIPAHSHPVGAASGTANNTSPSGAVWAMVGSRTGTPFYNAGTAPSTPLSPMAISASGNNIPHENMQPYLVANFCIATQGVFPSRN